MDFPGWKAVKKSSKEKEKNIPQTIRRNGNVLKVATSFDTKEEAQKFSKIERKNVHKKGNMYNYSIKKINNKYFVYDNN